jgi:hypothetical protein
MLREGRAVELPLCGISMRPLFASGDCVRVVPARAAGLRLGDVILVDLGERLLCHRLVYKTDTTLVTRGDDASGDDAPLPHAALLGRVEVSPSPRALWAAVRALVRSCRLPA